jgi:PAS domain S-box-containing protein
MIRVCDVHGQCIDFNDLWLDFTGRSLSQELNDGWTEGVFPADLSACLGAFRLACDRCQPFTIEYRLQHRDGSFRWILDHNEPYLSPQGDHLGFVGTCIDITSLMQARLERDHLWRLSLDPICIAGFDGYFKDVNPAWTRILGWTKEALTSSPFLTFVHPDDQQVTAEAFASLTRCQPIVSFENRYRAVDGSFHWLSWSAFPDAFTGLIFGIAHDITERRAALAAVEQAQETLSLVVNHIPGGIYRVILDPNLNPQSVFLSSGYKANFGFDPADVIAHPMRFFELIYPPDLHIITTLFHAVSSTPTQQLIEYRIKTADGRIQWVQSRFCIQRLPNQHILINGVDFNITHQKNTAEELNGILALSPDLICAAHISGYYLHVNLAFSSLLGWPEEELLTRPLSTFVHPDDLAQTSFAMRHLSEGQGLIDFENRLQCRGGGYRWIEWRATAPNEGGVIYAVGRDVTHRRREFSLMAEVERAAQVGGWELEFASNQIFWSAQTFLIHDLSPSDPTPPLDRAINFYAPSARPIIAAAIERARSHGEGWHLELPMITAKGREIWVLAVGQVDLINGVPVRVFGAFQDITHRKRAEEERRLLESRLLQSQKLELLGTFAGGIAHDFNKVLAIIMSHLEVVSDSLGPLQEVLKTAQQAKGFIEQILSFSQQQQPAKTNLKLQDVLPDTLSLLRGLIPARIQVSTSIDPNTPAVLASPSQLYQVLMNLCANSVHAIGARTGHLTLDLRCVDASALPDHLKATFSAGVHAVIAFRDDGVGMDPKMLKSIFEPFFTTKESQGTGLGLFVTQSIMQNLHGGIHVESEVGVGTTFSLYFPSSDAPALDFQVSAAGETPPLPPLVSSTQATATRQQHVLLIDDERMLLAASTRLLQTRGYVVTTFSDSRAALAALQEDPYRYDIAVIDLNMPYISGADIARELFKLNPQLPIIISSGHLTYDIRRQLLSFGVKKVLSKPWLAQDFFAAILSLLPKLP